MKITLKEAQDKVHNFLKERDWFGTDSNNKYYALAHMMEELGEVARCISHLESKRLKVMDANSDEMLENLKIELGDVLYHVFKIASSYDIDVTEAFHKTMDKNAKKFPLEKFGQEK